MSDFVLFWAWVQSGIKRFWRKLQKCIVQTVVVLGACRARRVTKKWVRALAGDFSRNSVATVVGSPADCGFGLDQPTIKSAKIRLTMIG